VKAFAPPKRLYGAVKGDVVKGVVIVDADAVGEVKDGGRAGTEGGVGEDDDNPVPVFVVDAEVVLRAVVGVGEEVLGAGTDVDAAAGMVPLRSHGFGGEPIGSNRTGR
jgi:hypothetical protein